jgi:hypothetical protein
MNASPSIRRELVEAVIGGIRERGPDAVGLMLMGIARLLVGAATLAVVLGASAISGYDLTAVHFAGLGAIAVLLNVAFSSFASRREQLPR